MYRDLLKVTDETISQAGRVADQLKDVDVSDMKEALRAQSIEYGLKHFVGLTKCVVDETQRRVLRG